MKGVQTCSAGLSPKCPPNGFNNTGVEMLWLGTVSSKECKSLKSGDLVNQLFGKLCCFKWAHTSCNLLRQAMGFQAQPEFKWKCESGGEILEEVICSAEIAAEGKLQNSGTQPSVTQLFLDYNLQMPSQPGVLARVSERCSPRTPRLARVGNHWY